ncbi:F-box protein [Pyrus ussuriensis x Pyrus communis]|uniref:F-box protein n=1 Tax=Pyrus ussuriensis x Pyrus communis TaxID=2448454 RepID=A0A5N5FZS5_9ROSA|nr:F-box protein [Pyrus ussuriensis x Pyrus communis]
MVCKKFNQLAQHDHIFEHISIWRFEKFDPLTSRRRHEQVYKFLERCTECNNPKSLKMVISKGHQASTHVYGAILVCPGGGNEKDIGINLLHSLKH